MNLVIFSLLLCLVSSQYNNIYITHPSSKKCIGIGNDGTTVVLLTCSNTKQQQWSINSNGNISNNGYCLQSSAGNGFLHIELCSGSQTQVFSFNSKGEIINSNGDCATVIGGGNVYDSIQPTSCQGMLTQRFATSQQVPFASVTISPPMIGNSGTPVANTNPVIQPPSSQIADSLSSSPQFGTKVQNLSSADHYLCVCIRDTDFSECVDAVKSACIIGHIPSEYCKQSFSSGNHEKIIGAIVTLIESGNKCTNAEITEDTKGKIPVEKFSSGVTVTEGDHYLCVCIDESVKSEDCVDAVKTACTLGHIPTGDCYASFQESNHQDITNHILRLIDSGAKCSHKLPKLPQVQPTKADEPSANDHYLCVCMDDENSEACKSAVKTACSKGHIPHGDCQVAEKGFLVSVSRHIMHLIDHGANCGSKPMLKFTNHGCHCKQSWSFQGKQLTSPQNCADPGGLKGFPWCETYEKEKCVGENGSTAWDRCDAPENKNIQSSGTDHYLCICIDVNSSSEVCQAAVRAACMVGHLPQKECRLSYMDNDHEKVTNAILQLIEQGERCKNTNVGFESSPNGAKPIAQASPQEMSNRIQAHATSDVCGHGELQTSGSCKCALGYAGLKCNKCADKFFNYPNCERAQSCPGSCKHGVCDFTIGKCECPRNWTGENCDVCAEGFAGDSCIPSQFVKTHIGGHAMFTIGVVACIIAFAWFRSKRTALKKKSKNYYDRVPELNWENEPKRFSLDKEADYSGVDI